MRKLISGFVLCVALVGQQPLRLTPGPGQAFVLEVDKTGLMSGKTHRFVFPKFTGEVLESRDGPAKSQVTFAVSTREILCEDTWVSSKDRQKILEYARNEMLAANQYPELRFRSTSVASLGAGQYLVEGQLTIRDRTRAVPVNVQATPDRWFTGSATVRLSEFGLKPAKAALGAIGTRDEMRVTFRLRAGS